jgi:trehalose synthase
MNLLPDQSKERSAYIEWLLSQSMLANAESLLRSYSGKGILWQRPYAEARPKDATALTSVWFTTYPGAIITRAGESVLETLADEALWRAFGEIGIDGLHTGPLKRAGGVRGRQFTPSIDGHFDRIHLEIDPEFGSIEQYVTMRQHATANGAVIVDDIVPAHTGKGADFRLAERAYENYPGLYHMIEIDEEDWYLLPDVAEDRDSVNLSAGTVDSLQTKGYIVGRLPRVIFYEPGVKETDWSATDRVVGADGVARRWVYLHYFKDGQPSLNWLDPSFAAQRLVIGDALHALEVLGAKVLRLDANGFLGIEQRSDGTVWSEGHPLSVVGNQLIAGMVRKAGGFTFQELNLAVDDIAAMAQGGADLSYDFITRPAYHHALLTGETEFLRLMMQIMADYKIDPGSLIHALQNHDELTLELVHFWFLHGDDRFTYHGREWSGNALRNHIRAVMYDRLTGENAPYNLKFTENGVASTTVSVIAAALGIHDLDGLTPEDVARIQQAHLLLAAYNAMQPGVFALSGWDLVGALPLKPEAVEEMTRDGDTRWINRGGYDLMDRAPEATASPSGAPRATALYGSIPAQLGDPNSFASQLNRMLRVRRDYKIYRSKQISVPKVEAPSLFVMVHELPEELGLQVTALNFGPDPVQEKVKMPSLHPGRFINMMTDAIEGSVSKKGKAEIELDGYGWKSLLLLA